MTAPVQRVVVGFAALLERLRADQPDDAAAARQAALAERRTAANERAILDEYAMAGIAPVMSNGRPVSLSLARSIGAGLKPAQLSGISGQVDWEMVG